MLWVLPTADTAVSPWDRLSLSPGAHYVQCSARRRRREIHPCSMVGCQDRDLWWQVSGVSPSHSSRSILSSAVTWPLPVGQECQLAVWGWLEVTQV